MARSMAWAAEFAEALPFRISKFATLRWRHQDRLTKYVCIACILLWIVCRCMQLKMEFDKNYKDLNWCMRMNKKYYIIPIFFVIVTTYWFKFRFWCWLSRWYIVGGDGGNVTIKVDTRRTLFDMRLQNIKIFDQ